MPRLISAVIVTALGASVLGCTSNNATAPEPRSGAAAVTDAPSAEIRGELSESFGDLKALATNATVIIRGSVQSSRSVMYGEVPFTIATVRVTQSLKGTARAGDLIEILQTGGALPLRTPRGTSSPSPVQSQQAAFEGIPVTQTGDDYIAFLRPYVGPIEPGAFVVLGEYQGRFKVDSSGVVRFTGTADQLAQPQFATQRAANGRTASDLISSVQQLLK